MTVVTIIGALNEPDSSKNSRMMPFNRQPAEGKRDVIFNFFLRPIPFGILGSQPRGVNIHRRNCGKMIGNWPARCDNYSEVEGLAARFAIYANV